MYGCPGRQSRDPGHAKIKPCTYPVEQCCWSRSQSAMGAAPTCEPPSGSGLRTGQVSMLVWNVGLVPVDSVFLCDCIIDGKREMTPPAWPFPACPSFLCVH
eukprot:scaffold135965_cov32-Tisochrysis_lutea.AAC.1